MDPLYALSVVVPRFSNVALGSVAALVATGTIETIDHMPALDALWKTGFGVAILVKVGLLLAALAVASGNLLRTTPALAAAREDPQRATGASGLHAYFVHSYELKASERADLVAQADYGGPVTAIVARDTMLGTQFHPEKSQRLGLALIANFLKWSP